jgi:DNA-binding GntR family transcriptional regulator
MPGVVALGEEYGVAPGTVARVLRVLADEGLVRVIAGWGTFRA